MQNSRFTWLLLGLAAGLVVGLNVAGIWPQVPLHAVATHGQDNFAICTAPMDEDVEAVFVLDDVTGDLKAAALNVQMRQFNTFFEYNVLRDLPTANAKNPTTASSAAWPISARMWPPANWPAAWSTWPKSRAGNWSPTACPGCPAARQSCVPFKGSVIPLDRWQFRTTAIRNP